MDRDEIRRELFQEIVALANESRFVYGPVGMGIVCDLLSDVERMVYPAENFPTSPKTQSHSYKRPDTDA